MITTFQELITSGIFDALVAAYSDEMHANILLTSIGYPRAYRPNWGTEPRRFWQAVCEQLENGVIQDGFDTLIRAAAQTYQGNVAFQNYINESQVAMTPAVANNVGSSNSGGVLMIVPGNYEVDEMLQDLRTIAHENNLNRHRQINLAFCNEEGVAFNLDGWTNEDVIPFAKYLEGIYGRHISFSDQEYGDYLIRRFFVEGPDQQRFEIINARASTTLKDIAQGVITDAYSNHPGLSGQRNVVIDHVIDGENHRLRPETTLDEAGIREDDTLSVSPEATAGLFPGLKQEALLRAQREIQRFAPTIEGFSYKMNVNTAPTAYEISFPAPGFEAPTSTNGQPVRINQHTVYIEFPDEFPMKAPAAFYQHPLFHPNVDLKSGLICMGVLSEQYTPNLSFARLIQMIIEIGSYRSYAYHHGVYNTNAAKWLLTEEGQQQIEEIGGLSILDAVVRPMIKNGMLASQVTDMSAISTSTGPSRRLKITPYTADEDYDEEEGQAGE